MDLEEDTYTSIFTALKHPVRRRILRMLDEGPATYTEILNGLGVETGFLNYHLEGLQGLISKDAENRYRLSDFGEAAINLIGSVEEPVRRRRERVEVFGFRFNKAYVFLSVIAVLIVSNAYAVYAYNNLSRERDNALGEALILAGGFLGESVNILNHTVGEGRVDVELFQVLRDDLIQLSRYHRLIMSLDPSHWEQWSQVQLATDSLEMFVRDLSDRVTAIEKDGEGSGTVIRVGPSSYLAKIRDDLAEIGLKSIPEKIVLGSNPRVKVSDEDMTDAMEAAVKLEKDVAQARIEFNLGFKIKIQIDSENFIWIPQP